MAQWIKTLVTKPDDLSSILNLYMVERTDLHMHFLQAHTKLISNCKEKKAFPRISVGKYNPFSITYKYPRYAISIGLYVNTYRDIYCL